MVVGVGEQLSSVGLCALMQCRQCRQVEADICDTGSSASLRVLGTIQVLPSKYMMLLTKSCLMLLSWMNVVPPIATQCRCRVTSALNLSGCSFL